MYLYSTCNFLGFRPVITAFRDKLDNERESDAGENLAPLIDQLVTEKESEVTSGILGESFSALLAVASLMVDNVPINIDEYQHTLPSSILKNIKKSLLPFLRAVALNGYQMNLKRKCFIVGNTGIKSFKYLIKIRIFLN